MAVNPELVHRKITLIHEALGQIVREPPEEQRLEGHRDDPRADHVYLGTGAGQHAEASLRMQVEKTLEPAQIVFPAHALRW